ncbi:DUF2062 domain-containing protein [Hydrogenophaga sp. 5NK40-0174]|uniref:DUF2062 domain-containing protein n=1 Tax=Hydrogenophaga sp. 5NK40-0174 TaxID=3127649 RepID=UPI003106BCBA
MKQRFLKWLPDREAVSNNRWLRWMGPTLQHPRLWHMSRKGIALGFGLGIFFGLLIPVAQIPLSAASAVVLRANLPVAVASTLVTNPVTFGPVYYGAYRLGKRVLGEAPHPGDVPPKLKVALESRDMQKAIKGKPEASFTERLSASWHFLRTVGKPLVVGLAITATVGGLLAYALTSAIWIAAVRLKRRNRQRGRIKTRSA